MLLREQQVENELAAVDFICVDAEHIRIGHGVPDGRGQLTLNEQRWAYCSAGLPNVPHRWTPTRGVAFEDIRHRELPRIPAARA